MKHVGLVAWKLPRKGVAGTVASDCWCKQSVCLLHKNRTLVDAGHAQRVVSLPGFILRFMFTTFENTRYVSKLINGNNSSWRW